MKAEYVDHMGSDVTVVNSARVSFNKHVDTVADKDARLIRYLSSHSHWTPFSHCQITLRETVPIFTARQRFKHMVGFAYNEVSRRYVTDEPEFYRPEHWHKPAADRKQGTTNEVVEKDAWITQWHEDIIKHSTELYETFLKLGVAPEEARMVLPQSMYTSYYVTGSLAAWARAYKLRIDPHAQKEIQYLATEWDKIIRPLYPVSWEALTQKEK